MSVKERHVTPGTEGIPRLFAAFPRLFPEESFGLLTALRKQEPSFADLRAIYTSEQAAQVRESIQATFPRKIGIQPPSAYQALFDAAAVEHTREQQLRAALIYGNFHIAEQSARSFYYSMHRKGMPVTLDECLDEALAVGIPKAIDSFSQGQTAVGFAAYMQTVVHHQLTGWYKHEYLHTRIPVRKAQRGEEVLQSTQVLQEKSPRLLETAVVYPTQQQETDPEQAVCLRETIQEIETTLRSRYKTPENTHYIEIFNASVQGASAQELAERFGKSAVAIQSVLRRAKRTVEHLRPPELQGAKRAQTFRKRHYATERKKSSRIHFQNTSGGEGSAPSVAPQSGGKSKYSSWKCMLCPLRRPVLRGEKRRLFFIRCISAINSKNRRHFQYFFTHQQHIHSFK